ncbi:MAG TPA: hypothetical protein PLF01_00165 [Alphaproteobacteria bacterium]|nr:hypothetical protein [Alphaproteobacteria bacterium]
MSVQQKLKTEHSSAAYDYKRGWSTTAHPIPGLSEQEYIDIAEAAQGDIQDQARAFMDDNGFSYIEIPHSDFMAYERSPKNFREWLEDYCEEKNAKIADPKNHLDPRADFAVVGPRVKKLESAERKTATGQVLADRLVDYAGVMFVALKQTCARKNKVSLNTLGDAMKAIEEDPRTLAIKNHYWEPHKKTQFRAHKSLWLATVPEGHALSDLETLVEVKIEHESQMDIDKLTRRFINIGREAQHAFETAFNGVITARDRKRATKLCVDEAAKFQAFDALGALLYNRVFADAGMNTFMKPSIANDFPPLSAKALLDAARATVNEHFSNGSRKALLDTITQMDMFEKFRTDKRPCKDRKREKVPA